MEPNQIREQSLKEDHSVREGLMSGLVLVGIPCSVLEVVKKIKQKPINKNKEEKTL